MALAETAMTGMWAVLSGIIGQLPSNLFQAPERSKLPIGMKGQVRRSGARHAIDGSAHSNARRRKKSQPAAIPCSGTLSRRDQTFSGL
jgi:hypothetical protein